MLQTIWHHSSVQFSLLFQMVHSVLLSVLHFKTILLVDPDWLLKVFHQSAVGVLKGNTESKTESTIWKSNENWTEKWCQIVCSILFDLSYCMTSISRNFPPVFSTAMASTTSFPTRRLSSTPPKSLSEWSSTSTETQPSAVKLSTNISRCWRPNTSRPDF